MLKSVELEFPRGWGESKAYVHGSLHGELSPREQVVVNIRRWQGTAMGGQAENHSATRALASPVRKDKVRSIVVKAGLWRFRGNTVGTVRSCGQELCKVDEAPSSQGPGEAQLEKGKQGEEEINDHHAWASHQTLAGPL